MIDLTFKEWWTVKAIKVYPWPCQPEPKRTFELHPGDVLTKHPNGTVTKHSGLCMVGIVVPPEDLVKVEKPIRLVG